VTDARADGFQLRDAGGRMQHARKGEHLNIDPHGWVRP
jgi:hypothetical protein